MAKNKKAPGPDEICGEVLKLIDDENINVLMKLFNTVLDTGIFPDEWLTSSFIALPKKN